MFALPNKHTQYFFHFLEKHEFLTLRKNVSKKTVELAVSKFWADYLLQINKYVTNVSTILIPALKL